MTSQGIGRYALVRELARNSAGTRFVAEDQAPRREVVVQVVELFSGFDAGEREAAVAAWLTQARALRGLVHPQVVAVLDVGVEDGVPFLATEHLGGTTLDALCTPDTRLAPQLALEIAVCIAEALAHAHSQQVFHGALSPQCITQLGEGQIKLDGFGLACPAGRLAAQDPTLGGRGFSPEQVRGAAPDARSDVFLLGCTLYELLTGNPPFAGRSMSSILYRVVHDNPPDLRARRIAPTIAEVLEIALAKRPEDRFDSCIALARALRSAAPSSSSAAFSFSVATHPRSSHKHPAEGLPVPRQPFRWVRRSGGSAPGQTTWLRPSILLPALALLSFAALRWFLAWSAGPEWLETRVQTLPAGLEVRLDDVPLDAGALGRVRFPATEPYASLSASLACRTVEHHLSSADATREVVLSVDPVELTWTFDSAIAGAEATVDGAAAERAPVTLTLDLCQAHRVELRAPGHRSAGVDLAPGAPSTEARARLDALRLSPIPKGRLELPGGIPVLAYWIDGQRVGAAEGHVELEEGKHRVRFVSEEYWIDGEVTLQIAGGDVLRGAIAVPPLGRLTVQAFPSNCRVFLRRPAGAWRFLDETPTSRQVAAGKYEVRVERLPAGPSQVRRVSVAAGDNPAARFSFEGGR